MLLAGFAPAQDQPDAGERNQPDANQPDANHDAPAILGRESSFLDSSGQPVEFGLFGKISGVYDSDLLPVFPANPAISLTPQGDVGTEASFGASVTRRWRRSKLSVEYQGVYRQYATPSVFDGLDQFFQLKYSRELERHVTLDFKSTVGTTTLSNGAFAYLPVSTLDRFALPVNELFDNRTNYLESRVDLTWQATARLSYNFGGDGFIVRRESPLLAGLNGYSARASVAYRLTARQTISASYNNTYFDFQRAFGNSRLQIPTIGYSAIVTRHWDFSAQAGAARVETLGLTQVAVDPGIAALTGQSFAIVTFSSVSYLPVGEARLVRTFKTASLAFDYSMGVTPGNGYYFTSRQNAASIIYSLVSGKNWEARGTAGFSQLSALGQTLGRLTSAQGGAEVFYNLTRGAHLDLRYDYRHYNAQDSILQRDSSRVSLGVAFSLGETFRTVR